MTGPRAKSQADSEASRIGRERDHFEHLVAQLGGIWGVVYSSLPVVVFVLASNVFGLLPAIGFALGAAVLILLWRLILRESTRPALSGFLGVAGCVLIAYLFGKTKDYFLLGIWMSLLWAVVFGFSVLIRRPIVGYLWSWAGGHDRRWRGVRRAVYLFDTATLAWMAVFAARFVVQRHLYDTDQTSGLGVARVVMGWPLTALAAVVTYLVIKAVQRAMVGSGDPTMGRARGTDVAGN